MFQCVRSATHPATIIAGPLAVRGRERWRHGPEGPGGGPGCADSVAAHTSVMGSKSGGIVAAGGAGSPWGSDSLPVSLSVSDSVAASARGPPLPGDNGPLAGFLSTHPASYLAHPNQFGNQCRISSCPRSE